MIRHRQVFVVLIAVLFFLPNARATVTLMDHDDWKIQMSGFAELDIFADSTRSFTEVVGNNPVERPGSYNGDNGRTQTSVRNSRLAFSVLPPMLNGWKSRVHLEMDLLGYDPNPSTTAPTNSESAFFTNPTLRIRHAFGTVENNGWTVLAGQTWTLFGWVPYYVLSTVDVPPVAATLYERTPQVMVLKNFELSESSRLQGAFSVVRPSQRDSMIPNIDAGVRYVFAARRAGLVNPNGDTKADPMSIGISGTLRQFVTPLSGTTQGTQSYLGSALAVNGMIPILATNDEKAPGNTLSLAGEATIGQGYGDEFPGWSGNTPQLQTPSSGLSTTPNLDAGQGGFDSGGAFHLTQLQSWNLQLQYHLPQGSDTFTTLGYGQLWSSNIGSLSASPGKIQYDRPEVYFWNVFHDFTKQVRVGVELAHFSTHYVDGNSAIDNRVQVSSYFRF